MGNFSISVPGSVNDLKFDQIQDRSCRVNWSPPREVNGILQGTVNLIY